MTNGPGHTSVLLLLDDAAKDLGPDSRRLADALRAASESGPLGPAAGLLDDAGVGPSVLDTLLDAAGLADYRELQQLTAEEAGVPAHARVRFTSSSDRLLAKAVTGESGDARITLERLAVSGALQVAAGRVVGARRTHLLTITGPLGYASLFADDLRASVADVVSLDGSALSVADALVDVRPGDLLVAFDVATRGMPGTDGGAALATVTAYLEAGCSLVVIGDRASSPLVARTDLALLAETGPSERGTSSPVVAITAVLGALVATRSKASRRRVAARARAVEALRRSR
jgi:DNA-binding MurR/RpiR family transcriptional regulator